MLRFIFLVYLCSNFLLIMSEGASNVTINVRSGQNCKVMSDSYTFTEGQNVTLVVKPKMFIHYGWWNVTTSTGSTELSDKFKSRGVQSQNHNATTPLVYSKIVDSSMGGTWEFKFYYHQDIQGSSNFPIIHHSDGHDYTVSLCKTNVTIEPALKPKGADTKFIIIASVVFAILVVIILAQAGYIVFLKAKAQKLINLNTHNNLSKKSDSFSNDTARYCSNPRQKKMKETIPVAGNNRDSVIYEAPNIEISSDGRMPMQPPQPPAINTMPRTPRSDHNLRVGPQSMLASALNSPAHSPTTAGVQPNFQRPKHIEREISLANRPPLPLPSQGHPNTDLYQELYEEMETDEENYMPPPVCNTMPPRLPMPPKKVPTGNLLGVKENTLKNRPGNSKPPVTPKPQTIRTQTMTPANELEQALRRRNNAERNTTLPRGPPPGHVMQSQHQEQNQRRRPTGDAQTNELQEALKRRNNVMQVPVVSIPDPSSRSSSNPRPGPPPVQTSKPPPMRQPIQEEIYYNEASSDEDEWTYEPLKPLNSYDQNIYNV